MDDEVKIVEGEESSVCEEVKECREEAKTEPAAAETIKKKDGNLGIFAMALLSLILPEFIGIILGVIALVKSHAKMKESESELIGASFVMSIIGIVLSVVSIAASAVLVGSAVEACLGLARSYSYCRYWWF